MDKKNMKRDQSKPQAKNSTEKSGMTNGSYGMTKGSYGMDNCAGEKKREY